LLIGGGIRNRRHEIVGRRRRGARSLCRHEIELDVVAGISAGLRRTAQQRSELLLRDRRRVTDQVLVLVLDAEASRDAGAVLEDLALDAAVERGRALLLVAARRPGVEVVRLVDM